MTDGERNDALRAKTFVQLAGSMAWLSLLYGALLYVAVGALGVSELTRRLGTETAGIIHMIEVATDIRAGEAQALAREEARLRLKDDALLRAIAEFRDFGIAQGLALQQLQPIIDRYDYAPRLSALKNTPIDLETEKNWAGAMGAVMGLQMEVAALKDRVRGHHEVLRSAWSSHPQVAAEAKRLNIDPLQVDRAAGTATIMRHLGYAGLFALPTEILTLLLALSMGALGSTLHITKTLLAAAEERPPSYYLIRPFQGMVTSLVVFVLLKAGQLTISAGDSDALNIFFVSFSGIASGLLAEEAYRMIRKAGAGIIKTDEAESRWAFKLRRALEDAKIDPAQLADGIRVPVAELDSWLSETHPVPPMQQRLIAAWLHLPERELFTAQPPEEEGRPAPCAPAGDLITRPGEIPAG